MAEVTEDAPPRGADPSKDSPPRGASWALLAGNFAIASGVIVTTGALNDIALSLRVSVALAGQLVSVAALVMAIGAPALALWFSGRAGAWDRRLLLTAALLWFALGHALSACMPSFASLLPVRALTMLGAALFTPQAAATISVLTAPSARGRALTFIFLGWSLASVLAMPMHSFVADTFGWRWAFGVVAALSVLAALAVWRAVPRGVRPPSMTLAAWSATLRDPWLMGLVAVTVFSATGQFTLFAFLAPYFRLQIGLGAGEASLLFLWFGAFGLVGNMLLTRVVDVFGAARCASAGIACIALALALWPLGTGLVSMAGACLFWGLGCFSSNSAQQARLADAAPERAQALIALNSSAMYLGQTLGAAGGGAVIAASGLSALWPLALAWLVLSLGLSLWLTPRKLVPA